MKSKESLKIVIYYTLFSSLWILFSDKLLFILTQDLSLLHILGNFKGFFFIILTAFILFEMIKKSYSKIENLNEQLQKTIIESQNNQNLCMEKNLELNKINNTMGDYFNLSLKMLSPIEYKDELFILEIFKIGFRVAQESDFGSAFIVKNNKLKFIDSRGFSLEELQEMSEDINLYKFSEQNIILNKNCELDIQKKLKNKNASLTQVKESLYVGVFKNEKIIGGFNLDISKNSSKHYSRETINKIQVIQQLSNGFYKIKKSSDYKMMLQKDIVQSFITALEFHDHYTKGHSESVASYSVKIGNSLDLDEKQLDDLYWAAVMHDIGKIIIPSEILNKKGKLSGSEYKIIKEHSQMGYKIVSQSDTLKDISECILYHHERWDGKGYPKGLKEDEIPLLSQIISVADSWHAMTSERVYKKQLTTEEGVGELLKNRGTQFSPVVVDAFIKIIA
ncbi:MULTISPECIES: HD-GYP domain-containing protein [Psychrilyobacter]|uniref:HD domain-containing protein n=1 Tax=Psychrilyobacter piezotolerans TaxID=2293438 RepID=A0ABX9KIT3_9FUSO|nr:MULTISPECIES: HD-GYP domain-containing protein [Psychrilyobacter]MCS5420602.1 HD-GYP domain-containing protein [Psychrilyobacter sp. S5]NDI77379.1 HD-GYP domain-containing protein [Psychrilyobacter piezotolerans]RDE63684.1 HD-GYP domain-containing protein [Psychrilyobacter sp. S5]REI42028.1 HD domain-containing protein [Psychrilyobacter piezotolerans]